MVRPLYRRHPDLNRALCALLGHQGMRRKISLRNKDGPETLVERFCAQAGQDEDPLCQAH